jgi:hypothetical protein
MEKIASKTEEETASMHIITFVTLVFLPGTFIAVRLAAPYMTNFVDHLISTSQSFLQSGVFQWNQLGQGEPMWTFKANAFGMFIAISLGLMFVTFVVWFLLFRYLRKRSRYQFEDPEDDASNIV